MKKLAFLALLLSTAATASAQRPVVVDRDVLRPQLRALVQQITNLQQRVRRPDVAAELAAILGQVQLLRAQLRQAQPAGAPVVMAVPMPVPMPAPEAPPAPPPGPSAVDEGALGGIVSAVEGQSFGRDKLRVLGSASESRFFSVAQVVRLLGLFSFGHEKLDALRMLAAKIVDRQDAYKVFEAFTFAREKAEAQKILR